MTEHKHLKALVRARMARTGESYTTARSQLVRREARMTLTPAADFRAHDKHCMTAVFTPDDRHIVSGGFGGQARIWTLDGRMIGALVGHTSSVNAVRIAADGVHAITAASDRTVRLWDLPARRERGVLGTHRKQVLALDLDAARDRAWTGGSDGRLNAWILSTQQQDAQVDLGGIVTSIAVRAADGVVAVATAGSGIVILGADASEITRLAESTTVVGSVTWAADGSFLLATSPQGSTLWASDGWEPVRSLQGESGSMLPAALSSDGSRIALGWDHHVGLWSSDETQARVTVDGLPKGVYGLSFSHDGRSLVAAAADGRVRIWSVT